MEMFRKVIRDVIGVEFGYGKNILNYEFLEKFAIGNTDKYQQASPFPHIVIDNFVSETWSKRLASEFPVFDSKNGWLDFSGPDSRGKLVQQNKNHISDENKMGVYCQRLHYEMKGRPFLKFLERLTSIDNLISDSDNHGGGIAINRAGSFLKVHADFNKHPTFKFDRRLNVLVYLNSNWQESWGGHLELWDQEMKKCQHKVLPVAGRCVIFNTTKTSYHGHPDPTTCPDNESRKSVAFYYYTNTQLTTESHSTLWQDRPTGES